MESESTSLPKTNKFIGFLDRFGVYILALGAVILNVSLAFDNVVWGDEAYSQMAIRNCSLYGIYERTYYWDSHPPLYYYFLRLMADIFGYKTPVYHFASLIPFVLGIVLACTFIKKKMGSLAAAFVVIISSLSASCVEYNLEIRMYSLVFFFVLMCCYYSYRIIEDGTKISLWVLMTLFGVLAAYTHYFGLIFTGILLFVTSVFYALRHKGKSFLRGLICIVCYLLVYAPWLYVLYFQTQAELASAWMTAPESLSVVINFIMGGSRLKVVILPFIILMSVIILISESDIFVIKIQEDSKKTTLGLKKPSVKHWSLELKMLLLYWISSALMLGFVYAVSFLFHPILAFRYTYVLIPAVLFILAICIKKLVLFLKEGMAPWHSEDGRVILTPAHPVFWKRVLIVLLTCMFLYVGVASLLDFKYFRSVTKTQDYQTGLVLDKVGDIPESTVLCSNGVKHLAWSVLPYYYPDNEVTLVDPQNIPGDPDEIWAFIGYEFDDDVIKEMEDRGYTVDSWMDMWLGKYGINLYHFYR